VTLGLTLTIPLAIVGDYFLQSRGVTMIGLGGAMLVVAAFGVIGWGDSRTGETEQVKAVIQVGQEEDVRV
jgi:solute carrier family 35 protein F5